MEPCHILPYMEPYVIQKFPMSYGRAIKRQSIHNRKHDEAYIQNFLSTKGLTPEDVEMAFGLISNDGHKITKDDIKEFADKYFKGRLKMVFAIDFNHTETNKVHLILEGRDQFGYFGIYYILIIIVYDANQEANR